MSRSSRKCNWIIQNLAKPPFRRLCRGFENVRDLHALSGNFLRQKSCYPESFRFLWLWSTGTRASISIFLPQQGRNLDLLTIIEPELAETEIDPNARKVKSYWWIGGEGKLDCIVNSSPSCNNLQLPLQVKKRVVMVMARQHPGESPASYVVQGLIDFLVSKHKIAQELREKLIFKVVLIWILQISVLSWSHIPIPGHSYDEPWRSLSWELQRVIAWWVS